MQSSRSWIVSRLLALAMLGSTGAGFIAEHEREVGQAQLETIIQDPYVQAVAQDRTTSDAVKIAMLMGHKYESSGKHIGTPYVDKLGKGQPLTVCNGITGKGVVPLYRKAGSLSIIFQFPSGGSSGIRMVMTGC